MAVITTIAEATDGALRSQGFENTDGAWQTPMQAKARAGNAIVTDPLNDPVNGAKIYVGPYGFGDPGYYGLYLFEGFMEFAPAAGFIQPVGTDVVTCSIRHTRNGKDYSRNGNKTYGTDSLQCWTRDWSAPLSSSAWVPMDPLANNFYNDFEYYQYETDNSNPITNVYEGGGELLLQNVKAALAGGQAEKVLWTTWTSLRNVPANQHGLVYITPSNYSTDLKNKPALILRTQKRHDLNMVGGSSIQLTDGTAVFLRYDRSGAGAINLYYQRVNQTSPTLIKKIPTTVGEHANYFGLDAGHQTFSITRDNANNIYIVGTRGALQGEYRFGDKLFNVMAMKYNGNYAWTYYTPTTMGETSGVDTYSVARSLPQNFSAVWVPGSNAGPAGQLVVFHSHRDAQWGRFQYGVAAMYAGWLIGDTTPGKNHKMAFMDPLDSTNQWKMANSSGTGLDAVRTGATSINYAAYAPAPAQSDQERAGTGYFNAPQSGTPTKPIFLSSSLVTHPHDPDSKTRQPWMGDSPTYYAAMIGGTIMVRQYSNDSLYRSIDFTQQGITGFPSQATLRSSQAWDIVWDSARNGFWIYYVDANNLRNVRKFFYDHIANTISSSVQINSSVLGPSGSAIEAIRLPRQTVDCRALLVDVAMRDASLAPVALIVLKDISNNLAPNAPLIPTINAFNATSPYNVDWTFSDPSSQDVPTAMQFQIKRVSTGVTVVDTGKVAVVGVGGNVYRYSIPANALANDTAYQIRALTYDSVDSVSPWSGWTSFSTSGTGGTVTITNPAADNPPLNKSSIDISWTYSNSTPSKVQNGYRVYVYNDATNALLQDSGVVASTATTRTVSGLTTDLRVRIEVQVRDTSGAFSGSGIRIVTPSFSKPSTPTVDVQPFNGYIEVRVTNPPPTGENPLTVINQIARKEATELDTAYKIIGTCAVNGVFQDYTVASGVDYTYKARGSSA